MFVVLGLLVPAAALAAKGDPRKQINAADQARAKTMLLRSSDLPGFRASRTGSNESHPYCGALDESDLTLTGEAESPSFSSAPVFVSSDSSVYESAGDASASWRRGPSCGCSLFLPST